MRLLSAINLELVEYVGQYVPPYSILSHTWGREEVTFQDLSLGGYETKLGFAKIEGCRRQTLEDGLEWFWVDTCCIDKSSSAELSEAINSMYRWYQDAELCYAFLTDVPSEGNPAKIDSAFSKSRWFSRGWTLQELLAPKVLRFYDMEWGYISSRKTLARVIARITGIPKSCVNDPLNVVPVMSVALKLSWASDRETLREEDQAYCLLGLLDVNMPLLYGEGARAFLRLQEEIMKSRYDQTILAWGLGLAHDSAPAKMLHKLAWNVPLLAPSPAAFRGWDPQVSKLAIEGSHYLQTNLGMLIELPVIILDPDGLIGIGLLEVGINSAYSMGWRAAIPLHIQTRKAGEVAAIAYKATGAWPFLVPETVVSSATRVNMYINRSSKYLDYGGGSEFEWRDLMLHGYMLSDYYPTNRVTQKDAQWARVAVSRSDILMRFKHPHLEPIALLWSHDPIPMGIDVLDGYAALAKVGLQTAVELLLKPTWKEIDWRQLRKSFEWSESVSVCEVSEPENVRQFRVKKGRNYRGDEQLMIELVNTEIVSEQVSEELDASEVEVIC